MSRLAISNQSSDLRHSMLQTRLPIHGMRNLAERRFSVPRTGQQSLRIQRYARSTPYSELAKRPEKRPLSYHLFRNGLGGPEKM